MRVLIAYYTRTNITKKIAEEISTILSADIEQIVDKKNRMGPLGYAVACRDAMAKKKTKIEELKYDPGNYDLVLLGTPVWVGVMAPALREYIDTNKNKLKNIVFFSTQGSANEQRVFKEMKEYIGFEPKTEMFFTTKEVAQDNYRDKLDKFCKIIKKYEGQI